MAIYGVDLGNVKVKVHRVRVVGLKRTKTDIVVEHVRDVLSATNLMELFTKSQEASDKLQELNIFKWVAIELDAKKDKLKNGGHGVASRGSRKKGRGKEEDGVEVTFKVKESGWFKSTIGAEAGTQSGGANISATLRNLLGRAEMLELASSATFPHWGHTVQLQFTKPYYKDLTKRVLLSLGTTDTKVPVCGYQEFITGSTAELQFPSYFGHHSVALGYNCRNLYGFTFNVPLAIREDAGHSIKSSLKHTFLWDDRDNPLFPTKGLRMKVTNEVAGLCGDVNFSKVDYLWESYFPLYKDWVFSLTFHSGLLLPLTPTKINDRFLLGGPSTLRGFEMWGVGPRENGYSLGGEAFWASGAHLFTPLPLAPKTSLFRRIRLHGFATAGNILRNGSLTSAATWRSLASASNIRLSCGVGLHFRLGIAQIELNYAVPVKAHQTDKLQPGLQFGIGVEML